MPVFVIPLDCCSLSLSLANSFLPPPPPPPPFLSFPASLSLLLFLILTPPTKVHPIILSSSRLFFSLFSLSLTHTHTHTLHTTLTHTLLSHTHYSHPHTGSTGRGDRYIIHPHPPLRLLSLSLFFPIPPPKQKLLHSSCWASTTASTPFFFLFFFFFCKKKQNNTTRRQGFFVFSHLSSYSKHLVPASKKDTHTHTHALTPKKQEPESTPHNWHLHQLNLPPPSSSPPPPTIYHQHYHQHYYQQKKKKEKQLRAGFPCSIPKQCALAIKSIVPIPWEARNRNTFRYGAYSLHCPRRRIQGTGRSCLCTAPSFLGHCRIYRSSYITTPYQTQQTKLRLPSKSSSSPSIHRGPAPPPQSSARPPLLPIEAF